MRNNRRTPQAATASKRQLYNYPFKKINSLAKGYEDNEEKIGCILVGRKKIEWIASHYMLSAHAKEQIIRRAADPSFDFKKRILESPLFWRTKNGCIAIALDMTSYLVVGCGDPKLKQNATVVTLIDTTASRTNVIEQFLVDYQEKRRKELR